MNKEEKIKAIEEERKVLGDEQTILSNKMEEIHQQEDKETDPLYDKINKIKKRYQLKIEPFSTKAKKIENKREQLRVDIANLQEEIIIEESTKQGKHTVDSIESLGRRYELFYGSSWDSDPIIEKKPLKNGIQVFRILNEREYSMWLFFDGLRLVAISYRRAGMHRGDQTYPVSVVGGLRKKNEVLVKVPHKWRENEFYEESATFTQMCKVMEEKDPKKLKEIEFNKENVEALKYTKFIDGSDWL